MVSKTGKTQVANNSTGIWQYEQIHWQKFPCIYIYIKYAVLFLLSSQTVVGYTQIRFDDNISIIISPCLNKSRKDIWQQWDCC